MDDARFDELAKALAGDTSRRALLKALGGGLLGGLAALRGADPGAARVRHPGGSGGGGSGTGGAGGGGGSGGGGTGGAGGAGGSGGTAGSGGSSGTGSA